MAGRSADISAVKNKPNRRRRCWLVAGLLGIGIGAILAVRAHLQNERVQALVREIEAKGGKVAVGPSVIDEIRGWWQEVIYPYEGGARRSFSSIHNSILRGYGTVTTWRTCLSLLWSWTTRRWTLMTLCG